MSNEIRPFEYACDTVGFHIDAQFLIRRSDSKKVDCVFNCAVKNVTQSKKCFCFGYTNTKIIDFVMERRA
ncbi:unnamed protein product [Hermetia illucens]|uniref:Uncharacterized protein n=1 Tax=Hermetia illucens TaxID=343691 RepID=A0A7R8YM45_HERIL|nr:unnamed protein product [Hermetia illucens]